MLPPGSWKDGAILPLWSLNIAIAIRLASGASYTWAVVRGLAKPNPVTWFFWSLTPAIAFVAQLNSGVGNEAWVTLTLAVGPFVIFITALAKNGWRTLRLTPTSLICSGFAILGITLWRTTDNPELAIIFSIFADIAASTPTVVKSFLLPKSEYWQSYVLSMLSMLITLSAITHWTFAAFAFPLYIFLINLVIFSLICFHKRQHIWVRPGQTNKL